MSEPILVALLALVGTLVGSFSGIIVANKLVNYRLEQLEKKVQAHNNLVERMYKLEGQMDEVVHEIVDLKKFHQPN